ncbi:MAG: DUF5682 family protein [Candidatus Sericytochromatia bacterium]
MSISIFGIRHHGQGSAKSLVKALENLSPDCVLIEGPTDANDIISFVGNSEIKPPVSILVYLPDNPKKCVIYPFAVFSPEWQGMKYAIKNNIPVSFIDLPQYYQLKKDDENLADKKENENINLNIKNHSKDPISIFAEISGYEDPEVWWDNFVENRKNTTEIFEAIDLMITNLRENNDDSSSTLDLKSEVFNNNRFEEDIKREAFMRQSIRKAIKDGYKNIAVICGAWHIPALKVENYKEKEDKEILSELKKEKTLSTWIPWTYDRLSYYSGYGAGIQAPNWYEHLWNNKKDISIKWIVKASRLFRKKDLDVSSAHLIETVRLAETLSSLRNRNSVGLVELQEAIKSVICFGNKTKLDLIKQELIIGNKIGKIPSQVPLTPLQADFEINLKKFRLKKELNRNEIDLDLRKDNDLAKSYFFHQISILDINWASKQNVANKKGTFHEVWSLEWQEVLEIAIIEAGIWGNTLELASSAYVINKANNSNDIFDLIQILYNTLFANLPNALEKIMEKLEEESALCTDIIKMMQSIPSLSNLLRYGNVRKTDSNLIKHILDGLITRVCIGLNNTCTGINYDAAQEILKEIIKTNDSLKLLQNEEYLSLWLKTINQISINETINKLISGYADRLLLDANYIKIEDFEKKMAFSLSIGKNISDASEWLEGFLKGSGVILIHNEKLLALIDNWLMSIPKDTFIEVLPILRRNFSNFTNAEKRQVGEIITNKKVETIVKLSDDSFSIERAEKVLPILDLFLL